VTFAAATGWEAAPDDSARLAILVSFGTNAVLNIAWNYFFFKQRRPDHALIEVVFLWLSIVAMIVVLAPFSPKAALFVTPYLVWVSIAALLNRRVVELNRPFGNTAEPRD
jgi:translocator protein